MVLMRAGHLIIHDYIRSLLTIILRHLLLVRGKGSNPRPTACVSDALATEPHRQFIYIYIHNNNNNNIRFGIKPNIYIYIY